MIWHYFPIGMRFPVDGFSEDTKRACWRIALSAAFASDAKGTGLYEACEPFDPVSNGPVYTCIVCYAGIRQARAAGKTMHGLDRLTARLCLYDSLVQANYLESFGPYPVLAAIDDAGAIVPEEAGAFLPTEKVEPMRQNAGETLLVALASETGDAERMTRALGTLAADEGFRVRRLPLACGGRGTQNALLCARGGRIDSVSIETADGTKEKRTVGVIPGPIAVIEADERTAAQLVSKTLDLGMRRILLASDDAVELDPALDERLSETELVLLHGDEAAVLDRIGLKSAAKDADRIVTNRPALFENARVIALPDGGMADALQKALGIGKGVANAADP